METLKANAKVYEVTDLKQATRRDNGQTYTYADVTFQIGNYTRKYWDNNTQSLKEFTGADIILKRYFHDEARSAITMFHKGDLAYVSYHHEIDAWGRTTVNIDRIVSASQMSGANITTEASAPAPSAAPTQAAVPSSAPAVKSDDLPF